MNETFKPFQQVLVRDEETKEWMCGVYSHYDSVLNSHCAMGAYFKECIPYEGNEALLGTTDSSQPKRWRAEDDGIFYFINAFGEVLDDIDNHMSANDLYNIGNYFRTREEAEAMVEKFKALLKEQ